jgi:hypothetical protein
MRTVTGVPEHGRTFLETDDREGKDMPCSLYEIRVTGQLDTEAAAAFADLSITASGGMTMLRGEFDQAGLHGLLEWIRALGLDLVDARRVRIPATSQAGQAGGVSVRAHI